MTNGYVFNAPPGWKVPPGNWVPPDGWTPDPSWPPAPAGWVFWIAAPQPVSLPAPPPAPTVASTQPPDHNDGAAPAAQPEVSQLASDVEPELEPLRQRVADLEAELNRLLSERAASTPGSDIVDLDDERVLQEVGIYRYHHPLENAAEYKEKLAALDERIKDMVKRGQAVLASDMFTFNNSLAKGRRMTGEFSKLMLRAYNAEADNCVRALRAGNVITAKKRLDASVTAIAKLGSMMEMRVNPDYHQLRSRSSSSLPTTS